MPNAVFKRFDEHHGLHASPVQRMGLWALVVIALCLPGLGGELKHSMLTHMGVQVSLLVLAGHGLGRAWLDLHPSWVRALRPYRWALLLLAVFTLMVWMLPRLLDLAAAHFAVDLMKIFSLTVCAGMALAWSWKQLPAVARGVLHLEALATLWRMGWLYLDSPTRLCLRYGLADQHRLGQSLMVAGCVYALWLLFTALRGHVAHEPALFFQSP